MHIEAIMAVMEDIEFVFRYGTKFIIIAFDKNLVPSMHTYSHDKVVWNATSSLTKLHDSVSEFSVGHFVSLKSYLSF